jgi:hypothetical protein
LYTAPASITSQQSVTVQATSVADQTKFATAIITLIGTVPVTVTSAPSGLSLMVDGSFCTAPCTFQWAPAGNHTIAVPAYQQAETAGTQYVYASWSDGGAASHSITVPSAAATYTANFTIAANVSGNSIFSTAAVPAEPSHPEANPITVGVKFRSDVSGTVTGIRFYKGAGNTGPHVGMLYSRTGTLLAQADFTSEAASGWQQVTFSSPITIAANTTYVAAYFTRTGYALNYGYFTLTGVDNSPLHALRSGVDGPNGVYLYGDAPQFPSSSSGDSNYWVDVAFSAVNSVTQSMTCPLVEALLTNPDGAAPCDIPTTSASPD